jgi:hypothetical protein
VVEHIVVDRGTHQASVGARKGKVNLQPWSLKRHFHSSTTDDQYSGF